MATALVFLAAMVLLGLLLLGRRTPGPAVVRASIPLPAKTELALDGIQPEPPAISPDGRRIAFVAREPSNARRLWVRELDAEEARPLEGTEDASYPFWSPDSRTIGFFSQHKLKKVPAAGGPVLLLCEAPAGRGGSWNCDDVILFSPSFNTPIFRVSAAGGAPAPLLKLDLGAQETSQRFPQFLPEGKAFLYLVRKRSDEKNVRIGSLEGGADATLLATENQAILASGHLLFLCDRTLMAQPFDAKRPRFTGEAFPVGEQVQCARALEEESSPP